MTAMATTYSLSVEIVDHLDNAGEPCDYCQTEGQVVQAQAYAPLDNTAVEYVESCLACLIPAIDATPYVDTAQTVKVEVGRTSTLRPF